MKKNKQIKDKIVILSVLLSICLIYIAIDKYNNAPDKQVLNAYKEGYRRGIQETIVSLYQKTESCQTAIIKINNVSRQIFDSACLKIIQQ